VARELLRTLAARVSTGWLQFLCAPIFVRSDSDAYALHTCRMRLDGNFLAVLHKALDISPNRVLHDFARPFHRIALIYETWERRNRHAISSSGAGSKTAVY
jgi:hypothetical protein